MKGELYDVDADGNLLVFHNYADYELRDSKYKDNENARGFLSMVYQSGIVNTSETASETTGIIWIDPWYDSSLDTVDFFNYKYKDQYYSELKYYIDEDKYVISTPEADIFNQDFYTQELVRYSRYREHFTPGVTLEISKEALRELYFRTQVFNLSYDAENQVMLEYFKPFQ